MTSRRPITVFRVMAIIFATAPGILTLTMPGGFNPLIGMLGLAITFSVLASASADGRLGGRGDTGRE